MESGIRGNRVNWVITILIGALLAGLIALTYFSYRQDIFAARVRVSSGSNVINTPCGLIEYAVAGKGPALLVIHGAGGGFDQGLEFGQSLIESGFQVIAMSRFGYLRTPLPSNASPTAQADAHACLLDALNVQRVAVLGGSAGAPSAMQLCLRHPGRCSAMVLLVPLAFAPHPAGEIQKRPSALTQFVITTTLGSDFIFWAATKVMPGIVIKTILATPPADFRNAGPDERARALKVMRHILPISPRKKGLENDAAIAASIPRYELERFAVPTLVMSTEDDLFGTFKSAQYTAEHIPGALFVGYPTGGHLWVGHQKDVWSEVTGFLNKFLR